MSLARILIAAVLGGMIVFFWGFFTHSVLQMDKMAFSQASAPASLAVAAGEVAPGTRTAFFYPPMPSDGSSKEQQELAIAQWEQGPRGIFVIDATPMTNTYPRLLLTELASSVIAAMIAAIVAAGVRGGYGGRVATVTLMGVFAWTAIDISYWNWYRFPDGFALMGLVDQGVGWLLAGLVIGAIARPRTIITPAGA